MKIEKHAEKKIISEYTKEEKKIDIKEIKAKARRKLLLFAIPAICFFLLSGTFYFGEAGIHILLVLGFLFTIYFDFIKNDPEFLQTRFELKETNAFQRKLQIIGFPIYMSMGILPALDKRFGGFQLSFYCKVIGFIFCFFGFLIIYLVFKQNRWASRTVAVKKEQKVISTGLYSIVRNPMYFGLLIYCIGTPLLLGSLYGLISPIGFLVFLVLRLINEEKVLLKELEGYEDYCKKVKYHLIPFIY